MTKKPITVNLSEDFYQILSDIQENLRQSEGKKTSLSDILLNLAQNSLENTQEKSNLEQNFGQTTQNQNNSAQNPILNFGVLSKKSKEMSENDFGFDKILRKKLKYLDEYESKLSDKEAELDAEREELFRLRDEFLQSQFERLTDLPPADAIQKKAYETAFSFANKLNPNTSSEIKDIRLSDKDMAKISAEFENVRNLMQMYHEREMRQFDTLRDQIIDVARELTFLLKNPHKQGVLFMQILPWAGMVLMPILSNLMKTDQDKKHLDELQDEIQKLTKALEKQDE